jgi:hypothetical protein
MVKIYNPTFRNVKCELRRFEKYERSIRDKRPKLMPPALDIRTLVARSPAPVENGQVMIFVDGHVFPP